MTTPRISYTHDAQGIARDAEGRAVYLVALNGGAPVLLNEDEILQLVETGLVRAEEPDHWFDTFRRFGGGSQ